MAYTKKWYEENKNKIGETRKERYHNDPEYRQGVLDQSRAYREKKKAERKVFLADPYIEIDGKQVPAVTMETLEKDTGVDKARLKYLQKAGYLPPALVTRPVRLYTKGQAELIKQLQTYLAEHSQFLRSTRTPEGQAAKAGLTALTETIQTNWST